jgi:ABC-type sugar transport system substrate-binding protein
MARFPWRRLLIVAAVLALSLGTVACGGDDSSDSSNSADSAGDGSSASPLDGKKLAYVTFGNASLYQVAAGESLKSLAGDQGAEVDILDGKFDAAVQQKAVDDAIAAGVDGIIWQPVDPKAAVSSIKAAKAANIPVVLVGGRPDPASTVPTVTFNESKLAFKGGQQAAEWVKKNQPGQKAKLVLFDIPASEVCRVWRLDSFEKGVKDVMGEENVEVVFRDLVVHDRQTTRAKMEDLLQSGREFNVFTACGADGAVGGIQALVAAGRGKAKNNVPETEWVMSFDGTPSELEYLLDSSNSLVYTVALTPKDNTEKAMEILVDIMEGKTPADSDELFVAPGVALPNEDCDEVNSIVAAQYGDAKDYKDLDCSKFE